MFESALPRARHTARGLSRIFGLFARLPQRVSRERKSQRLPDTPWLRRDIGLPRDADSRPRPHLYR